MRNDYTRMADEAFKGLLKKYDLDEDSELSLSSEDIEEQLYGLPYPETYFEYIKRVISKMPEFEGMNKAAMWEDNEVYKKLADMEGKSRGKKNKKDYGNYEKKWRDYLTGETDQIRRKTIFEMAIILHMSSGEFLKVLARLNGTNVNVHSAEEFLMYYFICANSYSQANWGVYTLAHYKEMLLRYEAEKKEYIEKSGRVRNSEEWHGETRGFTVETEGYLFGEIWKGKKYEECDEQVVRFMVERYGGFTDKIENGKGRNKYSVSNASKLERMYRYMFVLYAYSEKAQSDDDKDLLINPDNVYWYSKLLSRIGEGVVGSKINRKENKGEKELFEKLRSLKTELNTVENRIAKRDVKSITQVSRELVLFSAMALIAGFMNYYGEDEEGERITNKDLQDKRKTSKRADMASVHEVDELIQEWQDDVRFMEWAIWSSAHDVRERYKKAKKYLSQILALFNLFPIYPPNPIDRLVLLCLMSENPLETLGCLFGSEYE